MLTRIREKATGIFAWVIVTIITIPFALWGINSYFEGGGTAVVASAEGVDIDLNTYQRALAERRRMMAQVFQQNLDPAIFESREFKVQVLEGLIQNATQASYAEESGFRIGDDHLGKVIRTLSYFQNDGAFSSQRYQDTVRNAGMSVAGFEQQQRQQMISEQVRSAYAESTILGNDQLNQLIGLLEQQRTADYVLISKGRQDIKVSVSDEEIRKTYDNDQQSYFAPEQLRIEYVELSVATIAEDVELTEAEVQSAYDESKGRYTDPETRKVSHILISLKSDADESAISAAEEKAKGLAEQARAGADFAELARDNSDDTGSARNGGDLGILSKGVMVQPFEAAAYAMSSVGEITDPVRSRFGFHVIKLTELKAESIKSFEAARAEVEAELRQKLAEELFIERTEVLNNRAYEEPESLEAAADELQLDIKVSDWFSRDTGEGVATNERLRRVAFGEEVRVDGLNSEAFELDPNTVVAIRRANHKDRERQPFDAVKDEIRVTLEFKKRSDKVAEFGQALVKELENSGNWDELLEKNELTGLAFTGGRDQGADANQRTLASRLFSLPASDLPVYGGVEASSGEYMVFRLSGVTEVVAGEVAEERRAAVQARISRRLSDDLFAAYQERLRSESDIQIFEENL